MDATILADGRIVVANGGSGELRFFDSTGSHLASRGGQGEGPGEFLQLRSLEPWPGDSIVAWFGPRANISVFDSGGNYGRTIEINDGSQPWLGRPASTSVRGSILTVLLLEYADTLVMELRDGEGGLRTSLGTHPSWEPSVLVDEGTEREMQHVPTFSREPVWGVWGDLVAIGVTSRYEIKAYGADGSLVRIVLARIVRREHSPRVPTPEDVEAYIESDVLPDYPDATPSQREADREGWHNEASCTGGDHGSGCRRLPGGPPGINRPVERDNRQRRHPDRREPAPSRGLPATVADRAGADGLDRNPRGRRGLPVVHRPGCHDAAGRENHRSQRR